ncbi:MAG: adventurous gliding motility protein CglE [Myxococcales bacterium]|nr:adventurous gliding motility protein CglE [Myxococcales bacterium]
MAGVLSSDPAWAQRDVSQPGQAQSIRAVERGFFTAMGVGPSVLVVPDDDANYGLSTYFTFHGGWDILPILNLAVGVGFIASEGSVALNGVERRADRFYVSPNLRIQLAVITTERHFVWLQADGGASVLFRSNQTVSSDSDAGVMVGGGLGYEYFTTLRHFSIGLQTGLHSLLAPQTAFNIFLLPTLKYSF